MANELNCALSETGLTVTAALLQGSTVVASGIATTESGSVDGYYTGSVPGGTGAGTYNVLFIAGGVIKAAGLLEWTGSAEVPHLTGDAYATAVAIKAKTDNLPAAPAAVGDVPTAAQVADKVLGRNLAGGSDGGRTVTDALRPNRNKTALAGGTLTVYQEDDATPAWTADVTTATRDPISGVDPT